MRGRQLLVMTCTKCQHVIPRGSVYVAVVRHTERLTRRGSIKVTDSRLTATYHPECAPA